MDRTREPNEEEYEHERDTLAVCEIRAEKAAQKEETNQPKRPDRFGGAAKPRQATLIRGFCLHKSGVAMAICSQSSPASSRICRVSKGPVTLILAGKKLLVACWLSKRAAVGIFRPKEHERECRCCATQNAGPENRCRN
jgi:hypothetical protein